MGPSPDPATELQAAGRIHRLGQTKEVLIKRFAFRNTIEHAIVDMHEEIKAKRLKAGAGNDDPVVRQVFKLNLHLEVHTPTRSTRARWSGSTGPTVATAPAGTTAGGRFVARSTCCTRRHRSATADARAWPVQRQPSGVSTTSSRE